MSLVDDQDLSSPFILAVAFGTHHGVLEAALQQSCPPKPLGTSCSPWWGYGAECPRLVERPQLATSEDVGLVFSEDI